MTRSRIRITLVALVAAFGMLVLASAVPLAQSKPQLDLKAAMDKETVDRDLKAAIEMYRKLTSSTDRAVAAQAWLHMGQCYEKLGDTEARKAYEQIITNFPDQKETVVEAQARLAAGRAQTDEGRTGDHLVLEGEVTDISRDGRYVVLREAYGRLGSDGTGAPGSWLLRDRETGRTTRIRPGTGTQFVNAISVSPDLRMVAYTAMIGREFQMHLMSIDGTSDRILSEAPGPQGAGRTAVLPVSNGWSPDSTRLLVVGQGDVLGIMSVADGTVRWLDVQRNGVAAWSPDNRYILYANGTPAAAAGPTTGLFVIAVDGSSNVQLLPWPGQPLRPLWDADGRRILYTRDRGGVVDLLALAVVNGEAAGTPAVLKTDIGRMRPLQVTPDGTLFWTKSADRRDVFTVALDERTDMAASPASALHERVGALAQGPVAWSPDGRSMAFLRRIVDASPRLVIRTVASGDEREVPGDHIRITDLHWLPDGMLLAIRDTGGGQAVTIDPQSGESRIVVPTLAKQAAARVAVSADGRSIWYSAMEGSPGGGDLVARILRHDIGAPEAQEMYRTAVTPRTGLPLSLSVSPNGRRCAFALPADPSSAERNASPLVMLDLESKTIATIAASLGRGADAGTVWSSDGRYVMAVSAAAQDGLSEILAVPADGGESRRVGVRLPDIRSLAGSRDGRHLSFVSGALVTELWETRHLVAGSGKSSSK